MKQLQSAHHASLLSSTLNPDPHSRARKLVACTAGSSVGSALSPRYTASETCVSVSRRAKVPLKAGWRLRKRQSSKSSCTAGRLVISGLEHEASELSR